MLTSRRVARRLLDVTRTVSPSGNSGCASSRGCAHCPVVGNVVLTNRQIRDLEARVEILSGGKDEVAGEMRNILKGEWAVHPLLASPSSSASV